MNQHDEISSLTERNQNLMLGSRAEIIFLIFFYVLVPGHLSAFSSPGDKTILIKSLSKPALQTTYRIAGVVVPINDYENLIFRKFNFHLNLNKNDFRKNIFFIFQYF